MDGATIPLPTACRERSRLDLSSLKERSPFDPACRDGRTELDGYSYARLDLEAAGQERLQICAALANWEICGLVVANHFLLVNEIRRLLQRRGGDYESQLS
jgi:hypothetical protein